MIMFIDFYQNFLYRNGFKKLSDLPIIWDQKVFLFLSYPFLQKICLLKKSLINDIMGKHIFKKDTF